jgi:hypothetical protein
MSNLLSFSAMEVSDAGSKEAPWRIARVPTSISIVTVGEVDPSVLAHADVARVVDEAVYMLTHTREIW